MSGVLFTPPVVVGLVLLLALPPRWGLRLLALAFLAVAWRRALEPPVLDAGFGHAIGLMIVAFSLAACVVAIGLRLAVDLFRGRWRPASTARSERVALRGADVALAVAAAPLAAAAAFVQAGRLLQGAFPAPVLHLATILAGLALAALAARRPAPMPLRVFAGVAGSGLAALSVWGMTGFPAAVRAAAEARSARAPYCIALIERRREVRATSDLTFFGLDKSRGWSHHAVLLVEASQGLKGYHWSYHFRDFHGGLRTSTLQDGIPCAPRPDVLGTLDAGPGEEARLHVTSPTLRLAVPETWRPRFALDTLFLDAAAPDFAPAPRPRAASASASARAAPHGSTASPRTSPRRRPAPAPSASPAPTARRACGASGTSPARAACPPP